MTDRPETAPHQIGVRTSVGNSQRHARHATRIGSIASVLLLICTVVVVALMRQDSISIRVGGLQLRANDVTRPIVIGLFASAVMIAALWHRPGRRTLAIAGTTAFFVMGLAALSRRAEPMFPISDQAVTELSVIEASHGRSLTGPYSRYGWHHPGPLYFYLATPLYALGGQTTASVNAAALAVNLAALAILVLVMGRLARPELTVSVLALSLLYVIRCTGLMTSEWNAHVAVLPLLALIPACAAVASGGLSWLPVAVLLASFESQTHVAFAPLVLILVVTSVCAARCVTPPVTPFMWRRWLNASMWVLALVWLLPLVEQISHQPGNMTALWRFFFEGGSQAQTHSTAFSTWSDMFSGLARPGLAIPIGVPSNAAGLWWSKLFAIGACLLLAIAARSAWRKRRPFEFRLVALTGLACVVSAWSITRIADTILDHEVFWISAIGVLVSAAIVASALDHLPGRSRIVFKRRLQPAAGGLFLLIAAVIGVQELGQIVERSSNPNPDAIAVRRLSDAVREETRHRGIQKALIRIDQRWWPLAAGILLQMNKADMPFAVEPSWGSVFGNAFPPRGDEDWEITVAATETHNRLRDRQGNVTIAERGPVYIDAMPLVSAADQVR